MGPGYAEFEETKPDEFLNRYMGKQYSGHGGAGGRWKDPGQKDLGAGYESQDFPFEPTGFRRAKPGANPILDHSATEVLSMGLQEIVVDPGRMMMEDREYFNFMLSIINE